MSAIDTAMVLAAGLGTRMRPLTDLVPKPLVRLKGKPLLDHVLDRLDAGGIKRAVVNVHHFPDQIETHLKDRTRPQITISDERGQLLIDRGVDAGAGGAAEVGADAREEDAAARDVGGGDRAGAANP